MKFTTLPEAELRALVREILANLQIARAAREQAWASLADARSEERAARERLRGIERKLQHATKARRIQSLEALRDSVSASLDAAHDRAASAKGALEAAADQLERAESRRQRLIAELAAAHARPTPREHIAPNAVDRFATIQAMDAVARHSRSVAEELLNELTEWNSVGASRRSASPPAEPAARPGSLRVGRTRSPPGIPTGLKVLSAVPGVISNVGDLTGTVDDVLRHRRLKFTAKDSGAGFAVHEVARPRRPGPRALDVIAESFIRHAQKMEPLLSVRLRGARGPSAMILAWDESCRSVEAHLVYDGLRTEPERAARAVQATSLAALANLFKRPVEVFTAAITARAAGDDELAQQWSSALRGDPLTVRGLVIGGTHAPHALGGHTETNWLSVGWEPAPLRSFTRQEAGPEAALTRLHALDWARTAIHRAAHGAPVPSPAALAELMPVTPERRARVLTHLAARLDASGVSATTRGDIIHLYWQSLRFAFFAGADDGRVAWCVRGTEIGGTRRRADWIDVIEDRDGGAVVHVAELKPLSIKDLGAGLAAAWAEEFAAIHGATGREADWPYFDGMSDDLHARVRSRLGALYEEHKDQVARYCALIMDELHLHPRFRGRQIKPYAIVDWYVPPGAFTVSAAPGSAGPSSS